MKKYKMQTIEDFEKDWKKVRQNTIASALMMGKCNGNATNERSVIPPIVDRDIMVAGRRYVKVLIPNEHITVEVNMPSVVSKHYEAVRNTEAFSFIDELLDDNYMVIYKEESN